MPFIWLTLDLDEAFLGSVVQSLTARQESGAPMQKSDKLVRLSAPSQRVRS